MRVGFLDHTRTLYILEFHTGGRAMRVRIKYFAKYADLAGTRQEELEVGHIKIGELLRVVKEKHPGIRENENSLVALNGKYGNEEQTISAFATSTFFRPMSLSLYIACLLRLLFSIVS